MVWYNFNYDTVSVNKCKKVTVVGILFNPEE